jgi:outer membrane protein, heavy metal efflux system
MISVEQMIPNSKKLDAKSNSILAQAGQLKYDSAWLRNNLRSQLRLYYYERVIAEKKLSILKQSEALLDMLISIAESRYAVNQADLSTIFKAKAQRTELTNMEAMFNAQIAESNIGLNTLMNRDVNTPFAIDTIIVLRNFSEIISFDSLSKRSDLLAVDANIYSMRQQQNYMQTSLKPDFGVKISHMQMLGMPNQFSIMGMMTIPIAPWSSGMYHSEVSAMNFEIQSMQLEKENMQLMAKQMAAEKLAMLKYETQQLNNYDSLIIPAYQSNYDASFLAYKNNTGNFFILLDAWNMLLMKKMDVSDQLYKVLILQTQYEYEIEK